jgi:hypothetical protein
MVIAAKVIYGSKVLYIMLGVFAVLYRYSSRITGCVSGLAPLNARTLTSCVLLTSVAAFMTREFFIAIDPITTVHMGICNAPNTLRRAAALAEALRSRHKEFTEDPENLSEYAAMHYMDPEVRRAVVERDSGGCWACIAGVFDLCSNMSGVTLTCSCRTRYN